jgi:hypothetical protein
MGGAYHSTEGGGPVRSTRTPSTRPPAGQSACDEERDEVAWQGRRREEGGRLLVASTFEAVRPARRSAAHGRAHARVSARKPAAPGSRRAEPPRDLSPPVGFGLVWFGLSPMQAVLAGHRCSVG